MKILINLLTLSRIFIAIIIFGLLMLSDLYLLAFILFFLAGLTDYFDGFLARKYDASSHINIGEIDQVLNESGLNFEGDNKSLTINSPLNVPKFIKKHWSLVLSLRQQLEKD